MRISIEIDEATLHDAMELTGEKHRSPALAKAVTEFVRRRKAREFGRLMREGAFDYPYDESPLMVAEPTALYLTKSEDPGNPTPPLLSE